MEMERKPIHKGGKNEIGASVLGAAVGREEENGAAVGREEEHGGEESGGEGDGGEEGDSEEGDSEEGGPSSSSSKSSGRPITRSSRSKASDVRAEVRA